METREIETLIQAVASKNGTPVESIFTRCRKTRVVRARQEAIYQICRHTDLTFTAVGLIFDRTPATISHAFQKIANGGRQ